MGHWVGEITFAQRLFQAKFGRQPKSLEELMGLVRIEGLVSSWQGRLPAAVGEASPQGAPSVKAHEKRNRSGKVSQQKWVQQAPAGAPLDSGRFELPGPTQAELDETPLEVEPLDTFEDS